jgi:hypothetical protein
MKDTEIPGCHHHIFVGGGTKYYGPTAERDQAVAKCFGAALKTALGSSSARLYYGGQPGIPEDVANGWEGPTVALLARVHYEDYKARPGHGPQRVHMILGERERDRRHAFATAVKYDCALFIQGGAYSADEIRRLEVEGVPIVSFVGSGGASAGEIESTVDGNEETPYRYRFTRTEGEKEEETQLIFSTDPQQDPSAIAKQLAMEVKRRCAGTKKPRLN